MESENTMGKVLKIARIANKLSPKEASKLSGIHRAHIISMEEGDSPIKQDSLRMLAETYCLTTQQIAELNDYYNSLYFCDKKKYQYTLFKALEMIFKNSL